MKILKAFSKLGLNLGTGYSTNIALQDVEELVGKKLTGNGSTVRRDTKPWSFFNLENIKDRNKVIGYRFDGYKTRRELIGELTDQIDSSAQRVELEEDIISKRTRVRDKLSQEGLLSDVMYSQTDITRYI